MLSPYGASRQRGYQLLIFGLRPGSGGAAAHITLRAERKREFGHIVPARSFDDEEEIGVAAGQKDLLDFDSDFFCKIARGFSTLGRILDRTDALIGPIERQYERRHADLPGVIQTVVPAREV